MPTNDSRKKNEGLKRSEKGAHRFEMRTFDFEANLSPHEGAPLQGF